MFANYAKDVTKLAASGSTQKVIFNQIVSLKYPKNEHFRGTESLANRVSAAGCEKTKDMALFVM